MVEFASKYGTFAVADFVCPTKKARELFNADIVIWVDRIQEGRFEDTNKLFEKPDDADLVLKEGTPQEVLTEERLTQIFKVKTQMIQGNEWRAISWTTAASVAGVIELVASGDLPSKGFIKQEEIPFEKLIQTNNGRYYTIEDQ